MSEERMFTQAELDQIVSDRLKRERTKYQQEAAQRAAELDRRERLLTAKADWQKKGLPVDLLDALELSDDALERAESTLTAYMGKNKQPRMPANVGAPQPTNEYMLYHKGGGDPMRGAFGLGRKDES